MVDSRSGPDSTLDQQAPTFTFDKKELLKTPDKKEYEREKLQAQQTLYLGQQANGCWFVLRVIGLL